jgi:tRNA-modifying protein YgfZ
MSEVWWVDGGLPAVLEFSGPDAVRYLNGQVTQDVRRMEREFPAELGLDASDVSFHKGCYIGQEVISRIKSVGKVNRTLVLLSVDAAFPIGHWELLTDEGTTAGQVTSISPKAEGGMLLALARTGRIPDACECPCG